MSEEKVTTMQAKSLTINRVKALGGKIQIDYTRYRDGGVHDEISGTFDEEAQPSFYDSLMALTGLVVHAMELDDVPGFANHLMAFAVKFKYKDSGAVGAIVSAKYIPPVSGQEMTINSPLRYAAETSEDALDNHHLTGWETEAVLTMERQARAYLEGKRAQGSLFKDNGEPVEQTAEKDEKVAV